jgi:hypothetical protein
MARFAQPIDHKPAQRAGSARDENLGHGQLLPLKPVGAHEVPVTR